MTLQCARRKNPSLHNPTNTLIRFSQNDPISNPDRNCSSTKETPADPTISERESTWAVHSSFLAYRNITWQPLARMFCVVCLSNNAIALSRWWSRGRGVNVIATASMRMTRRLELNTVLLPVVSLVGTIISVLRLRRVRWCGLIVLVVIIRLGVLLRVVVVSWSCRPACSVKGTLAGFTSTARGEASIRLCQFELVVCWECQTYEQHTKRR